LKGCHAAQCFRISLNDCGPKKGSEIRVKFLVLSATADSRYTDSA
jgi:hypothetical protein